MLEILQFYVSGFWVWLGLTAGLGIVVQGLIAFFVGSIAALRGTPVHIGDITKTIKEKIPRS